MNKPNRFQKLKKQNDPPPVSPNFDMGYEAFITPHQRTRRVNDAIVIITACPFKKNTPQAREWQRGYNKAYFDNLEKLHGASR